MANISLRRNKLDQDKIFKIPVIDNLANNFKTWILKYIEWSLETSKRGLTVIFSIILISFIFVFSFILLWIIYQTEIETLYLQE